MMPMNKKLGNFSKLVTQLNSEKEKNNKDTSSKNSGTLLFFSFDIVESTNFKVIHPHEWAKYIHDVFDIINRNVQSNLKYAKIWRILGDELVFIINPAEGMIVDIIDGIYKILYNTNSELEKKKVSLSIKAAAWIAIVLDENNFEKSDLPIEYRNLYFRYMVSEERKSFIFEFLGNDIDVGFRIKQCSYSKQFVLSCELAMILLEEYKSNQVFESKHNNIILIDYIKLKGVWSGRPYPILWYYDKQYFLQKSLDQILPYDAKLTNEHIKKYIEHKLETTKELPKIARDLKLNDKIQELRNKINKNFININDLLYEEDKLYIHLVAVCCDYKNRAVFIAKRKSSKNKLPGMWEFGCAKTDRDKNYVETLKRAYLKDFGLKINPLTNEYRKERAPKPYALYEIPCENRNGSDKGIICFARIVDIDREKFKKNEFEKHEEARFIKESEYSDFIRENKENCVPDFEDTLKRAFKIMNKKGENLDE